MLVAPPNTSSRKLQRSCNTKLHSNDVQDASAGHRTNWKIQMSFAKMTLEKLNSLSKTWKFEIEGDTYIDDDTQCIDLEFPTMFEAVSFAQIFDDRPADNFWSNIDSCDIRYPDCTTSLYTSVVLTLVLNDNEPTM